MLSPRARTGLSVRGPRGQGCSLPLLASGTVQPDSGEREKSVWVAFDHLIDIHLTPVVARKAVSLESFPSLEKEKGAGRVSI